MTDSARAPIRSRTGQRADTQGSDDAPRARGCESSSGNGQSEQARTCFHDFAALRPAGGFGLIMADPPWSFETYSKKGQAKSAQAHYDCMTLKEIRALPVEALAGEHCVLWLWATSPMIREALDVCRVWGFAYKTMGVWVKRGASGKLAFGTGYRLRNAHEPFIIATRGAPVTARNVRSVVEGPAREHSRKPDEAFAAAEALAPGAARAELFSRQARPGWACWGAETGKFSTGGAAS